VTAPAVAQAPQRTPEDLQRLHTRMLDTADQECRSKADEAARLVNSARLGSNQGSRHRTDAGFTFSGTDREH